MNFFFLVFVFILKEKRNPKGHLIFYEILMFTFMDRKIWSAVYSLESLGNSANFSNENAFTTKQMPNY